LFNTLDVPRHSQLQSPGPGSWHRDRGSIVTDTLEFERAQLDRAYAAAEERIRKLHGQVDGGVQAVHNLAARKAADGLLATIQSLEDAVSPDAGILLKGKVVFADSPGAGDVAGESYYVAIAALGVIDQPQVMSWESATADAFRDPASWRDGESVQAKSIFVGGHRRLDLVQRVRTQGDGAGLPEDEALAEILLSRSGSELTEVVSTIQRSQFELMEAPFDEHLVIQGGPGTGKTIIGLHRISVLLYRHGERLRADDMLVITPTDTLARYVRHVLPGLGRGSVRVVSISGLERHGAGTPVPEPGDQQAAREAEQVKGLPGMLDVLRREVASLTRVPADGLEWGAKKLTPDEIRDIVAEQVTGGGTYTDIRSRIHQELASELGVASTDDRQTVTALFDQVAPDRSARQLVAELLSSAKRLRASGEGILTPAQQAAIKRRRTNVRDVAWTVADLPLLDAANQLLNGTLPRAGRFAHIVVDEAQDLSPMQLRMLVRRLAPGGAVTVLGDLAQATKGWANDSWALHLAAGGIEIDESGIRPLNAGYRVPKVQLEFANQLLPVMDIQTPETTSILDIDAPPQIIRTATDEELIASVIAHIRQLLQCRGAGESVGVIGLEDLLDQLQAEMGPAGVPSQWADTSHDGHVTVVTAEDAKGLEFDHVVVVRPEQIYRVHPVTGPRTLYVALTRARRSLYLAHLDPLPSALTGIVDGQAGPAGGVAGPAGPDPSDRTSPLDSQSRWMSPFRSGFALVEWQSHGPATVTYFGAEGGAPAIIAEGFTAGNDNDLHWAMRTSGGTSLSLHTSAADPSLVSGAVLAALDNTVP
jgi:DNA helicase IV